MAWREEASQPFLCIRMGNVNPTPWPRDSLASRSSGRPSLQQASHCACAWRGRGEAALLKDLVPRLGDSRHRAMAGPAA